MDVYFVYALSNFDSEKVHEAEISERQDVLHFFFSQKNQKITNT